MKVRPRRKSPTKKNKSLRPLAQTKVRKTRNTVKNNVQKALANNNDLLDISLRPLCTSTPNLKAKLKRKYNRMSTNKSLRRQALRKSVTNKSSQSLNNSSTLNNSSKTKKKKRRQKQLFVSPIAAPTPSGSGTDEGEPLARDNVPAASKAKSPEKLVVHNETSDDSDCCVIVDSSPAQAKTSKKRYVPIVRHRKPVQAGQVIDLDSDSESAPEDGGIVDIENKDQTNILFFEDKNGSYAMMTPMYKTSENADEPQPSLGCSPSIVCLDDHMEVTPSRPSTSKAIKQKPEVDPVTKRFEKFTTNEATEDSIQFLGETKQKKPDFNDPAPDFIRLDDAPVAKKVKPSINFYAARKEVRNAVTENPQKKKPPEKEKPKHWINPAAMQSEKRLIVVDGNNVCHLKSATGFFSVKRLLTIIKYFESRSHEVKVVVPDYRLNPFRSSDHQKMQQLFESGKIVKTPCKRLKDRKAESIYDDRVMLQIAAEMDGVVISGDNFRDITGEDKARDKIIVERVIAPIWVTDDMVMMPEDPYGRFGPKLKDILHRIVSPRKPKKS